MRNFDYCVPTKVIFGAGSEDKVSSEILALGCKNVLIVYGGGSIVRSGLLSKISSQLENSGIRFTLFGGTVPNPRLSHAREGITLAIKSGCDMVLAIGGGSVIDTAKAIALGAANPSADIWDDIWMRKITPASILPVGIILTIPAAGSETSDSAVLTNDITKEKRGFGSELNRPKFAAMNPALAASLPKYQVACGVTDIMMHTLDRYFNCYTDNDVSDEFAEALLRVVIHWGYAAVSDPGNYKAMSEIMWCGSLSHNGLTGLGSIPDFSVHQLSHELSGVYDKAHGAALASLWGHYASYVISYKPERFKRYAKNVWGLNSGREGIDATVKYFSKLGMPTCFSELGIGKLSKSEIEALALGCSHNKTRTIGSLKVLDHEDMRNIYNMANY